MGVKFLIVDDSSAMRMILRKMLINLGHDNILEAPNGAKAWFILQKERIEGGPVDIVLADWNMPFKTGIELLQDVRKSFEFEDLPFLMITAETEERSLAQMQGMGATDIILKPFEQDAFHAKITELLEKKKKSVK